MKEADIYTVEGLEALEEEQELDAADSGFMFGYLE